MLLAALAPAAVIVEYRFDGDAQDSSGNGEHGVLMGGATFGPSQFGQALQLDGVNDFVHVALSTGYTFTNFTLECWVNCPTHSTNIHYISLYQDAYLVLGNWSSGPVSTWADGLNPIDTMTSVPGLPTSTWHHFAFTWDGVAQRVYVDGVEQTTVPSTGAVTHDPVGFDQGLNIGARYTGGVQFVQGLIDNARIHDQALGVTELGFYADFEGVELRTVTATPTAVAPGQSGIQVTVDAENTGTHDVDVVRLDLTFEDGGGADVTGDYTVTPDPANPVVVTVGATEVFTYTVDVAVTATQGPITVDGDFEGTDQVTAAPVYDTAADTPHTWDVTGAVPEIRAVDAPDLEVAQGGTGYPVTVSIENTGLTQLAVTTIDLSFTGTVDRTSEYTVTPDPGNPSLIDAGLTEVFTFAVDVAPAASLETITLDAAVTGIDQVTSGTVTDPDADVTDTWTVQSCLAPLCGDCNGDGVVSIVDALTAAQHAAGLSLLSGTAFSSCNVLGLLEPDPGAEVNILDALALAQSVAGLGVVLSCC
jgi:hypothetical protein